MAARVKCPVCGQVDPVEKVSTVYLVGIGLNRQVKSGAPDAPEIEFSLDMPDAELRRVARRLAPPASTRKIPTRPLHPDLIVITFSLVIPIFLYGIFTSQASSLLPVLVILTGLYGLYFWKRKGIVARFENRQATQRAADERVKFAIERWMKLYYCAQDDGVFLPGGELVPADQLMEYLLRG
jgi:hypothetical protein